MTDTDNFDEFDESNDFQSEQTDRKAPSRRRSIPTQVEKQPIGALEVSADQGVERAMKVLKRKLIKEGLFKELKSRRYYEKPSERRKRKVKESRKKIRKEEARQRKNAQLFG
jgi:small subunit ribosomal protein S21